MRCSEVAGTSSTSLRFRRAWSVRGKQASIRAFRRPLTVLRFLLAVILASPSSWQLMSIVCRVVLLVI